MCRPRQMGQASACQPCKRSVSYADDERDSFEGEWTETDCRGKSAVIGVQHTFHYLDEFMSIPVDAKPLISRKSRTAKEGAVRKPLLRDRKPPDVNNEAFLAAAQFGTLVRVRRLLELKADVRATDNEGWTALHWAAHEGHFEVCSFLLQSGADPSAANAAGQTALQTAFLEDQEFGTRLRRLVMPSESEDKVAQAQVVRSSP